MEKRWYTVADTEGRPVNGATVQVNIYPGGGAATIYSDNGVTPKANPMATDSNGYFEYYAADGQYSWIITTNSDTKTINDIVHGTGTQWPPPLLIPTGTGNAMVVAAFSGGYTLTDGDDIRVRAIGENTVTNPTITLPVAGILTIYKVGGQPLNAQVGGVAGTGDIRRAGHELILRYRASPARMELINSL